MGTAVHDATGRKCSRCGKEFVKSSWSGRIPENIEGFVVWRLVCKDCHHVFHEANE